jgi:hypothetical protein
MRSTWLLLPLLLTACSGGKGDGTSGTDTGDGPTAPGDDDDDVTGDDDDDVTGTDTDVVHACHSEPQQLTIGSGAGLFSPLSAGDPVVLVHGPQGGWHIDIGGAVSGFSDLVEVAALVTVVGEGRTIAGEGQQPSRIALVGWSESSCSGEFYDIRAFVDDDGIDTLEEVCPLAGVDLQIDLTVSDLTDPTVSVTETLQVTAALDPVDEQPCASSM